MKDSVIAAMALCVAAAGVASAQQPAAAPAVGAERPPKVAVIDMNRVSSETLLGKSYAAQIEGLKNEIDSEGTKKQNELTKLDSQLKTLQDEIDKQANVLSPDALDKKRQEVVKKQRERQAFLEDGQQDLQRLREQAQQKAQAFNSEFQEKIKPTIEAVAKEKGVDILLDNQVAFWVTKNYDITQEVIVKADDAERAKPKTGGAAAAGAAAGAAKPAPAGKPSPTAPPKP
jgi:Skp family chaperone for outer membrane proteins